jgi:hypothetical protein
VNIVELTRAGLAAAKARGVRLGGSDGTSEVVAMRLWPVMACVLALVTTVPAAAERPIPPEELEARLRLTRDAPARAAIAAAVAKRHCGSGDCVDGVHDALVSIVRSPYFEGGARELEEYLLIARMIAKAESGRDYGYSLVSASREVAEVFDRPFQMLQTFSRRGYRINASTLRDVELLERGGKRREAAQVVINQFRALLSPKQG